MVEPKTRKTFYFIVFLLPCLIFYTLFFIYPFFNGFYISLTNWDGLTPALLSRCPREILNPKFSGK